MMKIDLTTIKHYNSFDNILDENFIDGEYVFFYGNGELDNRCRKVTSFFKNKITKSYSIVYNEEEFNFSISDYENKIKSFEFGKNFINKFDNKIFLLDSTSLGFAEILLVIHYLVAKNNIQIKILYIEPNEYKLKSKDSIFNTEFDLSKGFNSFRKIPPYSLLIDSSSSTKAKLITLLGFENERLSRILEDDDGARYDEFEHILALPAFKPGWENISLYRHYNELKDFKNLEFSPANNPYETNKILEKINKNSNNKQLVIAPIGTKPHSIGAIIFMVNSFYKNKKVGVIYDFPIKKENRTDGIGLIHEYTIKIND